MSVLFRRFRYDKRYVKQPDDKPFSTTEMMLIAVCTGLFFGSFFAFYFLINLTLIPVSHVLTRYFFFVFVSLVAMFFYFRKKQMTEYVFSLLISFGVIGPIALVLMMVINFVVATPYAVQTFEVPHDFILNEDKRVFELPLNEEIAYLGMPQKFDVSIFEMQLDADILIIEIGYGFFGYPVIKSKRFE
jgi:hypothetical protein